MATGIQVLRNDGYVLIDENYSNVALANKTSYVLPSYGEKTTTFPVGQFVNPMIALTASGIVRRAFGYFDSNGYNTYIKGDGNMNVTTYIFDIPKNPANYGLVIYRADGSVAFDASKSYARVVDVWSGSDFTVGGLGTRTYPAGRTYAVAIMKMGYFSDYNVTWVPPGDPVEGDPYNTSGCWATTETQKYMTVQLNGNVLTLGKEEPTPGLPMKAPKSVPRRTYHSESWAIAVLDVTGY